MENKVTVNKTDQQISAYNDMLEMKQIDEECREYENYLTLQNDLDIEEHAEDMLKLTQQFLLLLTKRSLAEEWIILSQIELQDLEYSWKEITWRRNDLYLDIDEYYKKNRSLMWEYVKDFTTIKTQKSTVNYKQLVSKFSLHVKNATELMVDLNERLAVLMLQIDPNSTSKLYLKTSTITKTNIILNRCKEITALFESKVAGETEFDEILRLNRRMAVVLKEADFIEFSDSHEKKRKAIRRVLKLKAEYGCYDEKNHQFAEIISRINGLNSDIEIHCSIFLQKCMNNEKVLQKLFASRKSANSCAVQNKNSVKDLRTYFTEIVQRFDAFNDEFEEIKELLDNTFYCN